MSVVSFVNEVLFNFIMLTKHSVYSCRRFASSIYSIEIYGYFILSEKNTVFVMWLLDTLTGNVRTCIVQFLNYSISISEQDIETGKKKAEEIAAKVFIYLFLFLCK